MSGSKKLEGASHRAAGSTDYVSLRGIYTWDGDDTIKICAADDQRERRTELKSERRSRNRIRMWKRKKRRRGYWGSRSGPPSD